MTEIVAELSRVLDMPDKSQALLQAWDSFHVTVRCLSARVSFVHNTDNILLHAIQDSFPALASGSSGSTAVAPAARPRRAAVSSRGQRSNDIWSRVQQAASTAGTSSAAHYPALPTSSARQAGGSGSRNTAWSSSAATSSRPSPTPSRPTTPHSVSFSAPRNTTSGRSTPARAPSGLDFPSLPSSAQAAAKAAQMREIFNRPAPSSTAGWGPSASSSGASTPVDLASPPPELSGAAGGKKKNKQNKKQILFSVTTTGH